MKKLLVLLLFIALFVWAALADVTFGDIARWGLVRRADLPAEGYRMVCVTNYTASFMWFVSGSFDIDVEGTPQVAIDFGTTAVPGLPKTLVMDGVAGLVAIGETGYSAGAFTDNEWYSGVGVLQTSDPFGSAGCYSQENVGGSSFTCNSGIANYYYGNVTLYRTDYPDIVTVTTNYCATGGGAVLRDSRNPRKSVRLVDGALLLLEEIPAHWVFQGEPCFGLSNPLTAFNGPLAGYTWATETAGDPPYLYYALYDEWSARQFVSDAFGGVTTSLNFTSDVEPYDIVPMTYVGPSVTTNSL
jgi:hypothetical protein